MPTTSPYLQAQSEAIDRSQQMAGTFMNAANMLSAARDRAKALDLNKKQYELDVRKQSMAEKEATQAQRERKGTMEFARQQYQEVTLPESRAKVTESAQSQAPLDPENRSFGLPMSLPITSTWKTDKVESAFTPIMERFDIAAKNPQVTAGDVYWDLKANYPEFRQSTLKNLAAEYDAAISKGDTDRANLLMKKYITPISNDYNGDIIDNYMRNTAESIKSKQQAAAITALGKLGTSKDSSLENIANEFSKVDASMRSIAAGVGIDPSLGTKDEVAAEALKKLKILGDRYKAKGGDVRDLGYTEEALGLVAPAAKTYNSPEEVRAAYQAGDISEAEALKLLIQ